MLHGWSQSGAMFRHQIAALRGEHRVIVPDLRGHGQSDKPGYGYRISRLATDVKELLDHLGVQQAAMVGWSMGASILWSFVDLFGTDRATRFVFVDQPSCVVELPGMTPREKADAGAILDLSGLAGLYDQIVGPQSAGIRAQFVTGMLSPQVEPALRDWILAENLLMPAHLAARLLIDHAAHDWRDIFQRIDRPVLIFGGDASHVAPDSQRWIASQLEDVRLEIMTKADRGSHFAFLENPAAFNRTLLEFLSEPAA